MVDDDPRMVFTIQESLKLLGGFTVFTAANGVEGLERFYAVHPDCVIIDVRMPEMDGNQLVRALRGDPETAATPLVILTAAVQDKDRFVGLAAGADCYLLKPVRPAELVQAINDAIRLSEAERLKRQQSLAEDDSSTS